MDVRCEGIDGKPTEYFCNDCKQLRLSLIKDKSKCGNCGSTNIVTGAVGSLDKTVLVRSNNGRAGS